MPIALLFALNFSISFLLCTLLDVIWRDMSYATTPAQIGTNLVIALFASIVGVLMGRWFSRRD